MRRSTKTTGAAFVGLATLMLSASAAAQAPRARALPSGDQGLPPAEAQPFERRLGSLFDEMPRSRVQAEWATVADAATTVLERLAELRRLTAASLRADAATPEGPSAPRGPELRLLRPLERALPAMATEIVEAAPAHLEGASRSVVEPRRQEAILLGAQLRMPWTVP